MVRRIDVKGQDTLCGCSLFGLNNLCKIKYCFKGRLPIEKLRLLKLRIYFRDDLFVNCKKDRKCSERNESERGKERETSRRRIRGDFEMIPS